VHAVEEKKLCIMHVEDEETRRADLATIIEHYWPYPKPDLVAFTSAEDAIKHIQKGDAPKPDIIISDYDLKKGGAHMNGVEFAMRLDELGIKKTFILASTHGWGEIYDANIKKFPMLQSAPFKDLPITAYCNGKGWDVIKPVLKNIFPHIFRDGGSMTRNAPQS